MENQRYKLAQIPVDIIDYNCGQIQGLKPNPREIDLQHLDKLKKQITEYPEMLEYRGLMVYKSGGVYVAIGGNQRLRAMKELNLKTAPCLIIPDDTDIDTLNAYQILDNAPFGKWDFKKLQENWDLSQLEDFAIDVPVPTTSLNIGNFFDEETEDEDNKMQIIITLPSEFAGQKIGISKEIKELLESKNYLGCKVFARKKLPTSKK